MNPVEIAAGTCADSSNSIASPMSCKRSLRSFSRHLRGSDSVQRLVRASGFPLDPTFRNGPRDILHN
jgi:hypothetical protein